MQIVCGHKNGIGKTMWTQKSTSAEIFKKKKFSWLDNFMKKILEII